MPNVLEPPSSIWESHFNLREKGILCGFSWTDPEGSRFSAAFEAAAVTTASAAGTRKHAIIVSSCFTISAGIIYGKVRKKAYSPSAEGLYAFTAYNKPYRVLPENASASLIRFMRMVL